MTNLEKQYINATGDREINRSEFNDFLNARRLMGFQYRNYIMDHLGIDTIELNKTSNDTIVYGSNILTISNDEDIPEYYKYNGLIIPKNYTLITQNPYDHRDLYDFNIYASKGHNIIYGIFGNLKDLDKDDKIYYLYLLRTLLQYNNINNNAFYKELNNNYYSYVYTKKKEK